MKLNNFLILAFFILLMSKTGSAQEWRLKGKVYSHSSKKGIAAVSVQLKNSTHETTTKNDGTFEIILLDTCTLRFSSIGYKAKELKIKKNTKKLTVFLNEIKNTLEAIVDEHDIQKDKSGGTVAKVGTPTNLELKEPEIFFILEDLKEDLSVKKTERMEEDIENKSEIEEKKEVVSVVRSVSKSAPLKRSDFYLGEGLDKTDASSGGSSEVLKLKSGTLTAGELNDFSKWTLWRDIKSTDLKVHQHTWKINPKERFSYQLTDKNDFPIIDQTVELIQDEKVIWSAKTDNTGKAEFWANLFENKPVSESKYSIRTQCEGQNYKIRKAQIFANGMNHEHVKKEVKFPDIADIAFVVDATGSMGDEIHYLKVELDDVINKVKENHKDLTLNIGAVFYRDKDDEYLTKTSQLNSDVSKTIDFIKLQNADGGGDEPEAADTALQVAVDNLKWSSIARARLLFLLLDAPPHDDLETVLKMQKTTQRAAGKGIKIIPIVCSGAGKSVEYLMRAIALATNATYTFLTDDSGIGEQHMKPTTDKWVVEHLNDLLIRLINQYLYVPIIKDAKLLQDSTINDKIVAQQNNGIISADSIAINKPDLNPKELEFDLKMYPNPTTGILNLVVPDDLQELYLADLSGKILERFNTLHKQEIKLDLSNYPNGLYFVKYPFKGKWKAGKVILLR